MKTFYDLKKGDIIYLLNGDRLTKCIFNSLEESVPSFITFKNPNFNDHTSSLYCMDMNVPYFNAWEDMYCIASIEGLIKFINDKC